ncbi:MAG TPA: hypothetical protein VGN39_18900 [Terriglobales bacterium]|jgi:uncharacterized membrane protein YphA (DoxX/SURF4 family)|nr:hypothetical protein [Terriglobales bacterium]
MKYSLGRYVYGLAAIASGVCGFVWHDFSNWHQIKALADSPHRDILTYIAATIEILGGVAVQWPRTARAGAVALGAIYFAFALLGVPLIIKQPLVYNSFGNFFEQYSLATGAMILYACSGSIAPAKKTLAQFGYYSFGVCVISFALEQLFYLSETASLVPKWIPPGQVFWAIATTAAFFLAALALLTGLMALLAAQLNTAIIVGFGLLVWLPALFANPHSFWNWSEGIETLAIAGSAWIVADFLGHRRSAESAPASVG